MADIARLLTVIQWLSPSFPVGGFSYSHGLEQAIAAGDVTDGPSFQAWLADILYLGSGRNDVLLLTLAFRAESISDLLDIDDLARAFAASKERLLETEQQGAAFAQTVSEVWTLDLPPLTYPVAVGRAARLAGLPLQDVAAGFLHGFAANLTAAAIRLVPLGQTEGQGILHYLSEACATISAEAITSDIDELGGCCVLADIASMQHETQYTRLFRS